MPLPLKITALLIILASYSCSERQVVSDSEKYVMQAFDSIRTFSIYKTSFNFDSLEAEVLSKVSEESQPADIHNELMLALRTVDKHCYMLTKEEYNNLVTGQDPETMSNPFPFQRKLLEDKYAYL